MAFPTPATKTNCDASTDDPKQALLTDLATLIDKFNALLAAAAAAGDLASSGITGAAAINGSAAQDFAAKNLTLAEALTLKKAANIASAGTINLTAAAGNFAHVTGTTTITAVTLASGKFFQLIFDAALTLTHHATNNNLPGGANITTAAGDRATYWSDGTTVYCVNYMKASGLAVVQFTPTAANALSGSIVQVATYETGVYASGTTYIPFDDTIPQNTEGDQYMSLAITPTNASNTLIIEAVGNYSFSTTGRVAQAVFKSGTADALSVAAATLAAGGSTDTIISRHVMTAGTTSPITFTVRAGGDQSGYTTYFNGRSGARLFGGAWNSSITIYEIKA